MIFTDKVIEYLNGQRLGRLATVTAGGRWPGTRGTWASRASKSADALPSTPKALTSAVLIAGLSALLYLTFKRKDWL